ncbi:DUF308 domain-containing protein [Curtobacterium luteum]|uniref:DUF4064 domain-containing protein n=1 Tax=Curtobacterium luteum TaxID=33881 RepID=A0A175RZA8_9MICO|nr:DUF308 domain-containing protein [Curtobacterium luteum]KTR09004.1 hypothetical protein NS184_04120 [Curtobacterium luteum]
MTNDDRSNEGRPADGQAPSWGSAPDASSADAPRYGEQGDTTPRYGERAEPASAPRYGEQGDAPRYGEQTAAPQYGSEQYREQQGQYGQSQYGQGQHDDRSGAPAWNADHQQPYAAAAATNHGGPSWQQYDEPKPAKKKTVGVVAFVLGLVSLIVGVVGGYLIGAALASSDAIKDLVPTDGSTPDQSQLQQQLMNDPTVTGQFAVGGIVIGIAAILGLWALVQGIIAIVTKRGRGWGVFAVILAVVATIATFATYIGVAAAAAVGGGN